MKKLKGFLIIIFTAQLVLSYSCKEKENEIPDIEIVAPEDGLKIMRGDQITVSVKASDSDGSVEEVRFYIYYEEVATVDDPPYEYLWTASDTLVGEVDVRAVALDNVGGANSDDIIVVVDAPGGFNPELSYGTLTDYDGNSYKTIEIGEQNWMAENLKVTHYADGTPIPFVTDEADWSSMDEEDRAYCWYDNLSEYKDTTGALYSWTGAMNGSSGVNDSVTLVQGVCPDGWHIPTDEDWKELEIFLGMSAETADKYDWRGSDEGGSLKEMGFSHWDLPNAGADNASGFTALPGGFRSYTGTFYGVGQYATFWTANQKSGSENIWYRVLNQDEKRIYRHYNLRNQGHSVRCVEDR